MFNFYVVLAGHDKVSDAGVATTCRREFKAPSLQIKSTKIEGPPENMGFNGKTSWRFQTEKRTKTKILDISKTPPMGQQDPKAINWISLLQKSKN